MRRKLKWLTNFACSFSVNLSWLQQIDFTIYENYYHCVKYARGSVLTLENTAHLIVINFIGSIFATFKP